MFSSTLGFVGFASKTFLGKVEKVGQVFVSLGVKKYLVVGQFGFNLATLVQINIIKMVISKKLRCQYNPSWPFRVSFNQLDFAYYVLV